MERTLTGVEGAWLVAGVLSFLGGVQSINGRLRRRLISGWVPVTGIVVHLVRGRYGRVTFEWQDHDGRVHQATAPTGGISIRVGTSVPVLFDPDDPARATINRSMNNGRVRIVIGAFLLAAGAVAGIVGVALSVFASL